MWQVVLTRHLSSSQLARMAQRMRTFSMGFRELAIVLGLAPFALAVLVHTARPSVPLSISSPARPSLAFDQYLIDLGRVQPTSEVRGTFVFENRGRRPVEIQEVIPSCGCLQPQLSTRHLEPGAAGAVIVRMQPANESPGRKEYYTDIRYTDPEPREVRVTFRLELPEQQLAVKPRALLVYQLSDMPTLHTISVSDTRDPPVQILDAAVNSPFVTIARRGSQRTSEHGLVTEFEVQVSPELPGGRHDAVVTIQTSDPRSPVIRVPMLMNGRPQP